MRQAKGRPLYASAARDNAASIRQKCGLHNSGLYEQLRGARGEERRRDYGAPGGMTRPCPIWLNGHWKHSRCGSSGSSEVGTWHHHVAQYRRGWSNGTNGLVRFMPAPHRRAVTQMYAAQPAVYSVDAHMVLFPCQNQRSSCCAIWSEVMSKRQPAP